MCDSSKQCGFDWIWTHHRLIRNTDLVPTFYAVVELITLVSAKHEACLQGESDSDDINTEFFVECQPDAAWVQLLNLIKKNYFEIVCHPTAMASGYSGVIHKSECQLL